MGRLSTFAKNRILNLRFQKSFRIKQIALSLQQEDDIKVSRKSISTFLKKYIETKSILDKPRSGRNKKLTPEEINLIGEITRLNRDITAPKIKEYLNLNVSTYTILRASKLFEWNKLNPNSNEAKKAAALKRLSTSEVKRHKMMTSRNSKSSEFDDDEECIGQDSDAHDEQSNPEQIKSFQLEQNENDLNLLSQYEIINAKNASSSAMVFATKILYKIFHLDELLGHNISGKTFNKYIKNKKPLDQKRIMYIKWLVENYFETSNREELWKSCRTAINKSIRNNEIKGGLINEIHFKEKKINYTNSNEPSSYNIVDLNSNIINELICNASSSDTCALNTNNSTSLLNLEPNMSIFQITNDLPNLDLVMNKVPINSNNFKANDLTSVVTLTDPNDLMGQLIQDENKAYIDLKDWFNSEKNLHLLSQADIFELKNLYCSPMIFTTKVLVRIFSKSELLGHNVGGKTLSKNLKAKEPLDETRVDYIKWLVNTYFNSFDEIKQEVIWKSCRKAINRVIRNFEIKESKLIKSYDEKEDHFEQLNHIVQFNETLNL